MKPFPFDTFEPKWQAHWEDNKTFQVANPGDENFDASKPKYFVLGMFPYPSGAGLHVGHSEVYTATDIIGRYKRMQGHNVLNPMGWDAFGLPAEQYAIKTGQHPSITTDANVGNYRRQLKSLGFGYDWDREINTTDPEYVKWTQWLFCQLYNSYFCEDEKKAKPISELEAKGVSREEIDEQRLAFISEAPVNWSPDLGTVLANEEVEEWKAKGHTVERRPLKQWMLRITKYAQRLIDDLDTLDWPESVKLLQTNWIGKSTGAEVVFDIEGNDVTVFTTRPDTLFGATYMVLAPEHDLVSQVTTAEQKDAVEAYIKACASKSDLERGEMNKDKSGVPTGAFAINPVNGEKIPVWIADYVMMGYGTGAIMAVPAHDERDFEFATKFELPIIPVVQEGSVGVPPAASSSKATELADPRFYNPHILSDKTTHKLPHWQQGEAACFVTWRLGDSLPKEKVDKLNSQKEIWLKNNPEPWDETIEKEYHTLFSDTIDALLDQGAGSCMLKKSTQNEIVQNALAHFDSDRYHLHAFAVMPNHVHVLFSPIGDHKIADIIQSWKSFTAKELNKSLGKEGAVWQPEYYDRLVRSPSHFNCLVSYILNNPIKAGLNDGDASTWPSQTDEANAGETPTLPYSGNGIALNSQFLDGMKTKDAKRAMISWLIDNNKGTPKTNFKLRDWLFSRQRYWGEPFPIIWEDGKHSVVPESELPVLQPDLEDFKPTGDPRGPLVKATDWIKYSETAERETNTMPQWAGSCWYYLRYCDPNNAERFISKEVEQYWSANDATVDLYFGGKEHAVLHLLYARFWHKVMFDLGHLSTSEPFKKYFAPGLILGETEFTQFKDESGNIISFKDINEQDNAFTIKSTGAPVQKESVADALVDKDGDNYVLKADKSKRVRFKAEKMSKSLGNIVSPDTVVERYGADSLRLYEMFMGPLSQTKPWQMKGVEGVSRFLAKVWRVAMQQNDAGEWSLSDKITDDAPADKALLKVTHETIKKVGEDIEKMNFNTAISQMMICTNAFTKADKVPALLLRDFLKCLNPFAPHITEEIHQHLGEACPTAKCSTGRILSDRAWPSYKEEFLVESEIQVVIQVNGKLRAKLTVAKDISKDDMEALALADENVKQFTDGNTVRKVIVIPGKLVNIVAN